MLRALLVMVFVGLSANIAAPAWACGCGAYIPDNDDAAVIDERALITWDGTTQDILMSFNVRGGSEKAAWVMPVPTASHVTAGDGAVFEELARLTAPRIEYRDSWWPTFGWLGGFAAADGGADRAPAGADVSVLSQQRIGPFAITRLAADDPAALADWLADNGFPQPPDLSRNIAPYVADGWEIVAIQLTPDTAGAELTGNLQPLRLSFASGKVVYPMRLSRSAKMPQAVDLYVIAEHRMDPVKYPVAGERPTLEFAGPVAAESVAYTLRPHLESGAYLTRWSNDISRPESIDGDYVFERADSDAAFQKVVHEYRDHGDVTGFFLLAGSALAAISTIVAVLIVWVWRARQAR
ncbi:DUF2330 domain-containing protein [Mycolicibacterium wolinskyi]|uniref:DUF2330 domain-containing protein n=1 Tax=Mycolicibacterium wolinskyi TaxID=59750 RepID=A0A1X2FLF0_9MYCO|nr:MULTISPECIES: DUF2330 domain-containing protein [Mycolicibacterium]MCV7283908.1 DUF2330 domain-containing protein [Mycolicibacterium wolinskyi]MCV7292398.1 DUF2330 domain-containing protein [Mycolicibacterium goodii]ORX19245.1 hypothetical protein AWC31_11785 [Mycolicibacterium wolinskyi]